ncbi:MAG: zinc ribbon domain-containing protein [Gemmatimonadaceae bacterium]|nr:zinc ribbon domain-containing protein [Gemmatimonadaceae bacterium]
MPTYEYRCANGHDFEEFYLRMSAAKFELPCPTCGLPGERRMSAGGGLLFKGSGFYITDYGKDGKKAAPTSRDSAGKGKGEGSGGDGAKSDGARGEGAKSDGAKADAPRAESNKSDSGKSGASASDSKPTAAPAAPPAKGGE